MKAMASGYGNRREEFIREEKGHVVILFTFCVIPLIFLIALIFNTARLTIRKMESQNAADAAALGGGVWMARGMNLMALNNNGMSETISVMITVRSTLQTAETMAELLPAMAAAVGWLNPGLAAQYLREAAAYRILAAKLKPVDNALSAGSTGFGWRVMTALDRLNQSIKAGFPALAYAQAVELARANGADKAPYARILAGMPATGLPLFPVARGPQRITVKEAENCILRKLRQPIPLLLVSTGPLSWRIALGVFKEMEDCNKDSLTGGSGVCAAPPGVTAALRWPGNPPKPMILTDAPSRAASATTDADESAADFARVRKHLQYLTAAFGQLSAESPIGAHYFENPARQWLTYGQADVYNPSWWSMFRQDWRTQLVHASLLPEKLWQLTGRSVPGPASEWDFINVH